MLAVDTNVVVRLVTNDDPEQSVRAIALFEREQIYLPKTVILETEWVLRYAYELERSVVAGSLRAVAGLPNVILEAPAQIALALEWFERGMDFADALHLASSMEAGRWATFDKKFASKAAELTRVRVVTP
jgi:predicted nucleic-acid-binding protein